MKAKVGKIYLTGISHNGGEISFQHTVFRGKYGNVAEQIDNAGLKRPSSAETASLGYDAWNNPKGKYEAEIVKILKNNWLWEFTGNLYLPKSNEEISNGVILNLNPKIVNGKLDMNKKSLIKKVKANDPSTKFVPFGYKIGEQTVFELLKNPYIEAKYGEEGAEKIAEIASKYRNKPRLWSFNSVGSKLARISALGGYWDFGGLSVNGNSWYGGIDGRAFGKVPGKLLNPKSNNN